MSDAFTDIARGRYFAGEPDDDCPDCNGTGLKSWGKLGVRKCVKYKGTGKKVRK